MNMIFEQIFALFFFFDLFLGAGLIHAENGGVIENGGAIFIISITLQIVAFCIAGWINEKKFQLSRKQESFEKSIKSKFLENFQGIRTCQFCNTKTSVTNLKFKQAKYCCCENCYKLALNHNMI